MAVPHTSVHDVVLREVAVMRTSHLIRRASTDVFSVKEHNNSSSNSLHQIFILIQRPMLNSFQVNNLIFYFHIQDVRFHCLRNKT